MKHIIKKGNKIIGFVYITLNSEWFYAFGRPPHTSYISFACNSLEHGIEKVKEYSL